MKELVIPPAAFQDSTSLEVLRVWIARNEQHITLLAGIWDDPGAWGILLADLARHIVNAYMLEEEIDPEEFLTRIRALFDAELNSPTDAPRGKIMIH